MTDELTWDELVEQTKARPRKTVEEANDQLIDLRAFNLAQMNIKPATKKRGNPEMQMVNEILDYLKERGDIYAWRMNAGKVKTDKGYWFQGAPDGTADIIGLHLGTGRMIAIEVKAGNNQPTELQAEFLEMVKRAGGVSFPAWSVDQVKQRLEMEL